VALDGEIAEDIRLDTLLDEMDVASLCQRQCRIGNGNELSARWLRQPARAPDAVDGKITQVIGNPVAGSSLPEPSLELLPGKRHALWLTGGHEPDAGASGRHRLHGNPPRSPILPLPLARRCRVLIAM
jgi:hypothetical protein